MTPSHTEYKTFRVNSIKGRYIIPEQIYGFLAGLSSIFSVYTIGESVEKRPIKSIVLGTGCSKFLIWSQMHGNESTTTKAVLDLISFLASGTPEAKDILKNCTLTIVPMLNPDGAVVYTRTNSNEVDLNRDAQQRTQPESQALRNVFENFKPDYCLNLHDQRTIFSVGNTPRPATLSFLAPSHDKDRSISSSRLKSMQLIASINKEMQKRIPGQIGRYDDAFNPNCTGDSFQMTGTPTLLFEAGHYPGDYQREITREYVFYALLTALQKVNHNPHEKSTDITTTSQVAEYSQIPENQKLFYDVIIRNAHLMGHSIKTESDTGILFIEKLKNGSIHFEPKIDNIGNLQGYYGHETFNCLDNKDLQHLKQRPNILKLLSES